MSESITPGKENRLTAALNEAVGLVQMLLYKAIRQSAQKRFPQGDQTEISMLAGAVTGEIFDAHNPAEKFAEFRRVHQKEIDLELLGLSEYCPEMVPHITDALRIQVLCDNQENKESSHILLKALDYGYLDEKRPAPLPSTFMTSVRELGKAHGVVVPPIEIDKDDEERLIH